MARITDVKSALNSTSMTNSVIVRQRLLSQKISESTCTKPAEIVSWFGAMQAQDYLAAKWAIGLRLPGATDVLIEQAIADRSIVRTWAFRGTLHMIAAEDVRWMLTLLRPRLHRITGTHCRKLDLNETLLLKSQAIMTHALQGGKELTRPELKAALEQGGILTHDLRLNLVLVRAAIDGVICCGCRRGKEFTYTLLDEWTPITNTVDHSEALAELTMRYFRSHGPATIADFVWWSGLTVADAKAGLELVKSSLLQEVINGQSYWMIPPTIDLNEPLANVYLLPSFDEYLVAYKDRRAALGTVDFSQIVSAGNGIFKPVIVSGGQVIGTWKRTIKKDRVFVDTSFITPLADTQGNAIGIEIERYRAFLRVIA